MFKLNLSSLTKISNKSIYLTNLLTSLNILFIIQIGSIIYFLDFNRVNAYYFFNIIEIK